MTRRALEEARVELNELMGRPPAQSLEVVAMTPPASTQVPSRRFSEVPEVAAAQADLEAAAAEAEAERAGRRPHLDLELATGFLGAGLATPAEAALIGVQPGWFGLQLGANATLDLTLPLLDFGVYRARLAQAMLAQEQSRAALVLAERQARMSWTRATADLAQLEEELTCRNEAVPRAWDAYLEEESLYRGGHATGLEVLDAFTTWRDARVAYLQAVLTYWNADAERIRWKLAMKTGLFFLVLLLTGCHAESGGRGCGGRRSARDSRPGGQRHARELAPDGRGTGDDRGPA